jgi:transcriptional regulator NrdR family protein
MKSLCGADTLVREPLEAKTNPKKVNEIRSVIIGPFNVFMDALREIFDESAYARFLETHRMVSSPAAYGDFLRETEAVKERRPRCC